MRSVRTANPNVTEAEFVDGLFDGLASHLMAYFVKTLDKKETTDEFLEHVENVACTCKNQKLGVLHSIRSARILAWRIVLLQ